MSPTVVEYFILLLSMFMEEKWRRINRRAILLRMQPMMGELIMWSIDASVVEMMGELQLVLSWSRYQDDAPEDECSNDVPQMMPC